MDKRQAMFKSKLANLSWYFSYKKIKDIALNVKLILVATFWNVLGPFVDKIYW